MPPMPVRPTRSAVPRVVGILAIIFASIGLMGSLIWAYGPMSDIYDWNLEGELGSIITWLWVWMGLSVVVFVVHLVGGIQAIRYKRSGLRLLTVYAIAALALALVDAVLVYALMPSRIEGVDGFWRTHEEVRFSISTMHAVFSGMALPWPIVVLALVNGARAKEACGTPTAQAADVF
jgi:hypothetical protein